MVVEVQTWYSEKALEVQRFGAEPLETATAALYIADLPPPPVDLSDWPEILDHGR